MGEEYEDGKHGKFVGYLNLKEFGEFINHVGISYDGTPNMGSLGLYGCSHCSSIIFEGHDEGYEATIIYQSAYVTPSIKDSSDIFEKEFPDDEESQKLFWEIFEMCLARCY